MISMDINFISKKKQLHGEAPSLFIIREWMPSGRQKPSNMDLCVNDFCLLSARISYRQKKGFQVVAVLSVFGLVKTEVPVERESA